MIARSLFDELDLGPTLSADLREADASMSNVIPSDMRELVAARTPALRCLRIFQRKSMCIMSCKLGLQRSGAVLSCVPSRPQWNGMIAVHPR